MYNIEDDNSDAYRALFLNIDYQQLMRSLTRGRGEWKCHPSTLEVMTFQMKALKPVPKVWYNFLYAKLKPSLHMSIMTKDKTILLYAIVQGIKFDVSHALESRIIESTQGHCIGALIHPSLITQRATEVPMLESKEKSYHQLPLTLPKSKDGAPNDMNEEEEDAATVGQQTKEDLEDEDLEADLRDAIRRAFARLSAHKYELEYRQQMHIDHAEHNITIWPA